jgi:aminoglycoside phosphotransferase (APT) family kinase protein
MILTRENVIAFLAARGVIASDASPAVSDLRRTNRVFRVAAEPTVLFVKQSPTMNAAAYAGSRREASLYGLAAHDEALRRLAPRLAYCDSRFGVLVTEERAGAVDFAAFAREEGRAPADFEEKLADALARHHARALASLGLHQAEFDEGRRCPAVLTLGHARPDAWIAFGPIGPQVAALFRRRRRLARLFNETQIDWRFDALIHGDLGFENIVLYPRSAVSPLFYFVDWEMACLGDAAWDLATILRPALTATMTGRALEAEFGAISAFRPPPLDLAPRSRFWRAYARGREWNRTTSRAELFRVVRFSAIQIAWSVIERSRRTPKFDPEAIHAVEAALDLALEPSKAAPLFESE